MSAGEGRRIVLIVGLVSAWIAGNLFSAFSGNLGLWLAVFGIPFALLFGLLLGEKLAK